MAVCADVKMLITVKTMDNETRNAKQKWGKEQAFQAKYEFCCCLLTFCL